MNQYQLFFLLLFGPLILTIVAAFLFIFIHMGIEEYFTQRKRKKMDQERKDLELVRDVMES
jgi:hypothetical protein